MRSTLSVSYVPSQERKALAGANERFRQMSQARADSVKPVLEAMQRDYRDNFPLTTYSDSLPRCGDSIAEQSRFRQLQAPCLYSSTFYDTPSGGCVMTLVTAFKVLPEKPIIDTLENRIARKVLSPTGYDEYVRQKKPRKKWFEFWK